MLKFLYFDLGNVLLYFDHERACRGMGKVAGVPADVVRDVFYQSGLAWRYELGEVTDDEMLAIFARETGTRADAAKLIAAAGDIFEVNESIVPVVRSLKRAGHRLGILSNTCSAHWEHCANGRYEFISQSFDVHALSFRIKAAKPDLRIYDAARELAQVDADEIFFVDDLKVNVDGALCAEYDAVQYTTTDELIAALRKREIEV